MWFYHKTYLLFWKSFGRNRGYFLLFLLYWFVIHKFSKKSLLSTFKLSKSASEIIFQKCVGFVSNLAIKWNEVVFFVKFFFFSFIKNEFYPNFKLFKCAHVNNHHTSAGLFSVSQQVINNQNASVAPALAASHWSTFQFLL